MVVVSAPARLEGGHCISFTDDRVSIMKRTVMKLITVVMSSTGVTEPCPRAVLA